MLCSPITHLKACFVRTLELLVYSVFRYIEEGTMANLKAEFHEHLTRHNLNYEEMSIEQ